MKTTVESPEAKCKEALSPYAPAASRVKNPTRNIAETTVAEADVEQGFQFLLMDLS